MSVKKVSEPYWVTGCGNVGFVATTNDVGEVKVRVGAVAGHDESADTRHLADWGSDLKLEPFADYLTRNTDRIVMVLRKHGGNELGNQFSGVARRYIDATEVLSMIEHSLKTIRTWHGMRLNAVEEQGMWDIYYRNAPEVRPLRELRERLIHEQAILAAVDVGSAKQPVQYPGATE